MDGDRIIGAPSRARCWIVSNVVEVNIGDSDNGSNEMMGVPSADESYRRTVPVEKPDRSVAIGGRPVGVTGWKSRSGMSISSCGTDAAPGSAGVTSTMLGFAV